MTQYNNSGYLFQKYGSFEGKITIDGVDRRLRGFWKESKGGKKNELISIAVLTEEEFKASKSKMPKPRDYEYQELESFPEQNIDGDNPAHKDIPF